jgi:hypothetical protein
VFDGVIEIVGVLVWVGVVVGEFIGVVVGDGVGVGVSLNIPHSMYSKTTPSFSSRVLPIKQGV